MITQRYRRTPLQFLCPPCPPLAVVLMSIPCCRCALIRRSRSLNTSFVKTSMSTTSRIGLWLSHSSIWFLVQWTRYWDNAKQIGMPCSLMEVFRILRVHVWVFGSKDHGSSVKENKGCSSLSLLQYISPIHIKNNSTSFRCHYQLRVRSHNHSSFRRVWYEEYDFSSRICNKRIKISFSCAEFRKSCGQNRTSQTG